MGWAVGYDQRWARDIGYGVPALCDQPGCGAVIDRGLAYVCGGEPYGGDLGCGLFFCDAHHAYYRGEGYALCARCALGKRPYMPTPDVAAWIEHKATDPSWAAWSEEAKL